MVNRIIRIIGIVILSIAILELARFLMPHKVEYDSDAAFKAAGGDVYFEIPDGAQDCYYSIFKEKATWLSYVSFSLADDDSRIFIEKNISKKPLSFELGTKVSDLIDNERWRKEGNEIIQNCDHYKDHDGDIEAFTIIWFNPMGTNRGSPGFALLVNESNGRIVWYKESSIF